MPRGPCQTAPAVTQVVQQTPYKQNAYDPFSTRKNTRFPLSTKLTGPCTATCIFLERSLSPPRHQRRKSWPGSQRIGVFRRPPGDSRHVTPPMAVRTNETLRSRPQVGSATLSWWGKNTQKKHGLSVKYEKVGKHHDFLAFIDL